MKKLTVLFFLRIGLAAALCAPGITQTLHAAQIGDITEPRPAHLIHLTDFDEKGLVGYLATNGGRESYINPAVAGLLTVTASSLASDSEPATAIAGNTAVRCVTTPVPDSWVSIDFHGLRIQPTHYSLRHYSSWDTEALRNWVLEGSNDGTTWITISTHVDDTALNSAGDVHTWTIPRNRYVVPYSKFRVRQTGLNSNNHHYLALSGFEVYGTVEWDALRQALDAHQQERTFSYTYDFDGNGIVSFMATNGLPAYTNPEQTGRILSSASSLAPDSEPSSAILGTETVRCVTQSIPDSWMAIELTTHKVVPTHYTLRHYSSWDTEALRNWVFEGSSDGMNWTVLRVHSNDTSLDSRGATQTWSIRTPLTPVAYTHFRVRQTGLNSNNHYFLALSGIELYGTLYPKSQSLPEDPTYTAAAEIYPSGQQDQDLIYYIGTAGYTRNYENPAFNGFMEMSSSLILSDSELPEALLDRELIRFITAPRLNAFAEADFKGRRVTATHYGLQHYTTWDSEALRNWVFEGSNDGVTWDILKTHVNDTALRVRGQWHVWPVDPSVSMTGYTRFRVRLTGPNSNNHLYLALSGLRVFGTLHSPENHPPLTPEDELTTFEYSSGFDQNGIVYHLATSGGNTAYENPAEAGLVATTASSLMSDSEPASAIVGTETVRCVTQPLANSWMEVDFKRYEIRPTHYSLRHYSSWDTEALRNWVLEASLDGMAWHTISQHVNDSALYGRGSTHTWPLSGIGPNDWYTHFRIRQTGPNSNNHYYLALSGFEVYGTLAVHDAQRNASLRVNLSPVAALNAGARWSIDGGTNWQSSGTELTRLYPGSYTARVTSISHHWPPENLVLSVAPNQLNEYTLAYTAMDNQTDTDADGIPDLWESQNTLNPSDSSDALLDHDGDGQVTLFEYHAGTKIYSADSRMEIWLYTKEGKSELHIQPGTNMDPFVVETSASLESWTELKYSSNILVQDERIITDSAPLTSNAFYRIRLLSD